MTDQNPEVWTILLSHLYLPEAYVRICSERPGKNQGSSFPLSTANELNAKTLSGPHFPCHTCCVSGLLGITHTEQASFPRKRCSEGQRSAYVAGLSAVRTLTWAPALTFGWRVLREQEKIITRSAGLGPFFWNEHQHWQFSYESLTKPPFNPVDFLHNRFTWTMARKERLYQGDESAILFSLMVLLSGTNGGFSCMW